MVSHTFLYKKLDEFGVNHNSPVLEKVKTGSKRLSTIRKDCDNEERSISDSSRDCMQLQANNGQKIVFDNFYFIQKVHHMSESHQNIDNYRVVHMSVENRVSGNHLSLEHTTSKTIMANFFQIRERILNRENYVDLVSRHHRWQHPLS